jgi:hypothetical protein
LSVIAGVHASFVFELQHFLNSLGLLLLKALSLGVAILVASGTDSHCPKPTGLAAST